MVDGAYQLLVRAAEAGRPRERARGQRHASTCSTSAPSTSTTSTPCRASAAARTRTSSRDRIIRPGDQAFFDIIHTFIGYKTCYYRTFVVGKANRRAARRLQAGARVDRQVDRADASRRDDRPGRERLAEGAGVRLRQRDGVLRAPVRPQRRPVPPRAADHQPAQLARAPGRAQGGHGHRPRDLLPGQGRRAPRRGSRRRSSSPPTARRSSPASRPTSCSSPTRTDRRHEPHGDDRPRHRPRRPGSGCTGRWSSAATSRSAPRSCSSRGSCAGTTHLGVGQEAVAAGVAAAMRDDDYTFCTYRGHNHTLARGVPMAPIFAELFGRGTGLLGGKGGSMHLTSAWSTARWARTRSSARTCRSRWARRGRRSTASRARSRSASSATGRPTSGRSTRRSTWPRSGRRRSSSCARTTSTWSTRRSAT